MPSHEKPFTPSLLVDFSERLLEISEAKPDLTWPDLWDLYTREIYDETRPRGSSVSAILWKSRLAEWLMAITDNACDACGKKLEESRRSGSKYCDSACAQAGHRARRASRRTEAESAQGFGQGLKTYVEREVAVARRFASELRARGGVYIPAPNWLRFSDLPSFPTGGCGERCGGEGACAFTRGPTCMFAQTPGMMDHEEP